MTSSFQIRIGILSFEFEWTQRKVGKFGNSQWICTQAIIKLSLAYSFQKKSKFKARLHDVFSCWTFDLILINSRYLVLDAYFSPHQRNIVYEYKLHGKPIMK